MYNVYYIYMKCVDCRKRYYAHLTYYSNKSDIKILNFKTYRFQVLLFLIQTFFVDIK